MDLNKSANLPKSPDAKTEGGSASSMPVNMKAEGMDCSGSSSLVAPPRRIARSPKKDSASVPDRFCRRESYCFFVQVQKDSDAILTKDQWIDPPAWNEHICKNICENQLGAELDTFSVQLISDTEFLLYEGNKNGPGMTWDRTVGYIRHLQGIFPWCGIPAFLVAGQCTLKQSRVDVTDSFWYRHERT